MTKTVAIIGGGPSGLVTAKSMLEAGFKPTLFEARKNTGGVWAPREEGCETTQLHPEMYTNGSIFSSSFSDWFPYTRENVPVWFTARDMALYLEGYKQRYLADLQIRTGVEIQGVEETETGWNVAGEQFDYLAIATGVFTHPHIPLKEELERFPGRSMHSLHYNGDEILQPGKKHKILVVGGCLSGAEIPADIALRASSTNADVELVHLAPQPFWILPKLLPFFNEADPTAPRVLPLDQVFFNAEAALNKPRAESPEAHFSNIHSILKTVMGGDQSDISPECQFDEYWSKRRANIGMSESYANFVKSGAIKPMLGRFAGITEDGNIRVSSPANRNDPEKILEGFDTIVFTTGYTPWPAIQKLFAPSVLSKIGVSPDTPGSNPKLSLYSQLYKFQLVSNPDIGRKLGFIGIHPRPFWGIVELQAKWLAGLWTGALEWPSEEAISDYQKGSEHLMKIGKIDEALLHSSQGGYLELISDFSKQLGLEPYKPGASVDFTPKTFMPAHFSTGEHSKNAQNLLRIQALESSISPQNLSRAIFAQLHGKWNLKRTLVSKLPGFPDGTFIGTAEFAPRIQTFTPIPSGLKESGCRKYTVGPPKASYLTLGREVPEYLYSETGELTTTSGLKLQGKRKYIYQCSDPECKITAWFVKPDGNSVDYFFHEVDFSKTPEKLNTPGIDGEGGWKAADEHLCERDWYYPAYRFLFKAARLERFFVRYKVRGPQKDYISEAEYTRDS
ncbi:hypothetical protein BZA77DRAFT_275778 [Pyronema omphalodes]|nr:hypothetical protein BZA77DRAFT_275778 [Pyronema omphalodes]